MDIQQLPDEEVFRMSSEALRIADRNTALYMLQELQTKVRLLNGETIDDKDEHQELEIEESIRRSNESIRRLDEISRRSEESPEQINKELDATQKEIAELKAMLAGSIPKFV